MHLHLTAPLLSSSAACHQSSLAASRSSYAPLTAHRQQLALRQTSFDHLHQRRGTCTCSAMDSSGQGPDDTYRDISSRHQAPNGDYEGPQLVPLDVESGMGLGGTSEDVFGELAVLLVGFTRAEVDTFRRMMDDMEADFVPVIPVSSGMLEDSLEAAVTSPPPPYEQLPAGTRRAIVMSGMSTAEVMEVIGAYSDTDSFPESLFGAAVPKNYDRNLQMLLAEMYDDKDYKSAQDKLEGLYQQS